MGRSTSTATAVIAAAASISGDVYVGADTMIMIVMPAAWTAASLTFQVSIENAVWRDLYDDAGTEVTISAAASRAISLDPTTFVGAKYIRVRSGTAGAPVVQAAERTLLIAKAPIVG